MSLMIYRRLIIFLIFTILMNIIPPFISSKEIGYSCSEIMIVEYRGEKDFIITDLIVPVPPNTSHQISFILNVTPQPLQVIHRGDNFLTKVQSSSEALSKILY